MIEIEFAEATDPGRLRTENQDVLGHTIDSKAGSLFVVADGAGGHEHGAVAAQLAVSGLLESFHAPEIKDARSFLATAIQSANLRIHDEALALGGTIMATTVIACLLSRDRAVVAHVGDSRAFLLRHGRLRSLTRDHTVAEERRRLGLGRVFARGSRAAADWQSGAGIAETENILSRALGPDLFVRPDLREELVIAGDTILLCCDGVHRALSAQQIAAIVEGAPTLGAAAFELIEVANRQDGSDNVSVQLIRVRRVDRGEMPHK